MYAVEPHGKDLGHSLEAGRKMWHGPGLYLDTIADGLRVQQIGDLPFSIVKDLVEKEVFKVV